MSLVYLHRTMSGRDDPVGSGRKTDDCVESVFQHSQPGSLPETRPENTDWRGHRDPGDHCISTPEELFANRAV